MSPVCPHIRGVAAASLQPRVGDLGLHRRAAHIRGVAAASLHRGDHPSGQVHRRQHPRASGFLATAALTRPYLGACHAEGAGGDCTQVSNSFMDGWRRLPVLF